MSNYKELWDESKNWLLAFSLAILFLYVISSVPPKFIDADIDCYKFVGTIVTGLKTKPEGFNIYKELVFNAKKDGFISFDECYAAKDLSENVGKRKLVFQ